MISDSALMKAIHTRKSQAAFRELFQRHGKASYALALHVTSRVEWAEEALQETMLAVWRLSGSYRDSGHARKWLMRIVVQMSLRVRQREMKFSDSKKNSASVLPSNQQVSFLEEPEESEARTAVRHAMKELPPSDQRLLALRFEYDLTQAQIGTALSMPDRTVSYRLGKCLDHLRGCLSCLEPATA